jgi:hypothetical protein
MGVVIRACNALLLLSFVASGCLVAQQPAKPLNPTPLERPSPVATVRTADVILTLHEARDSAVAAGFKVTKLDQGNLLIDARRLDRPGAKNYDRVLIWLQRTAQDPLKEVELYLLYGRYEEVWADQLDIYRVVVSDDFEEARIGALRTALGTLTTR